MTTTAAPDAVSFAVSGTAVYGDHITVRIGSASGLHEIAVHETGSGTPLGAYTVTPSVPATTAVVPLSPVPHSTSLTITITALGSTPGALDTITFYLPRDTTVPTNIASNVCTGGGYRYGYNTQIKENEIAGEGNHYSALYWEYDPRVARRWNVDPVDQISASNYSVLSGNPIWRVDPLGNTDDIIEVDTKEKSYSVTKTNDPYDIVIERRENGKSGLAAAGLPNNTNDGINPIHFQKGSWQKYLNYKGYTENAPLRGAQSAAFAVEMAAADGAGKLIGKGIGMLWGKVFGRTAAVGAQAGGDYAKLLTPKDEFDVVKTLYRGTTGSEAGSSVLFVTDDAAVAASYVKNGGQVMQYQVTEFGLKTLYQAGELEMKTGIHGAATTISTEYMFRGKNLVQTLNGLAKPVK